MRKHGDSPVICDFCSAQMVVDEFWLYPGIAPMGLFFSRLPVSSSHSKFSLLVNYLPLDYQSLLGSDLSVFI